jgi:hypothetical protein
MIPVITRPSEVFPKVLIDELLRVVKLDRNWVEWIPLENRVYQARCKLPTWITKTWTTGADAFSMWAASIWLVDGPKFFTPTLEQCRSLEQISVNLTLDDYAQPYQALMVNLPKEEYTPFKCVLCHRSEKLLTCSLMSNGSLNDITTTIAWEDGVIEQSLQRFDDELTPLASISSRALRIAVNSCLALVNYGCHKDYLFPKEVERDKRLLGEKSERGQRARTRLETISWQVSFDQEITLHQSESHTHEGEETGREVTSHWRRGHWAMQPYGPQQSLRKRILRKPVLVRADKFLGEHSSTSTSYK